jgi:hypothetical protein
LHKRFIATRVWQYGFDPEAIEGLLKPYGWCVIEQVSPEQLFRAMSHQPSGR